MRYLTILLSLFCMAFTVNAAKADRRVAGMTAPAHGLVLWKVFY